MRVRRFVTQISEDQGHFTVAGAPGQVATNGDETERSDDALADIYTSRLEDGGVIESTDQGRNQTVLITLETANHALDLPKGGENHVLNI